jgi:hypothetical protein
MEAYNFILEERKRLLRAKRDGKPYYPSDSVQITPEKKSVVSREKRQACTPEIKRNQYNGNFTYAESYCNGYTSMTFYCKSLKILLNLNYSFYIIGENSNITTALILTGIRTFAYQLQPQTRKIMDATFNYCLKQYTCGGQNVCSIFPDIMPILKYVNSCLTTHGLIDELAYPPNASVGM